MTTHGDGEFPSYDIDRISEKLGVTDHLPSVPVCCHELYLAPQVERSFGNRTKLRCMMNTLDNFFMTISWHVFSENFSAELRKKVEDGRSHLGMTIMIKPGAMFIFFSILLSTYWS